MKGYKWVIKISCWQVKGRKIWESFCKRRGAKNLGIQLKHNSKPCIHSPSSGQSTQGYCKEKGNTQVIDFKANTYLLFFHSQHYVTSNYITVIVLLLIKLPAVFLPCWLSLVRAKAGLQQR